MTLRRPVVKVGLGLSVCTAAVLAGVWLTYRSGSSDASSQGAGPLARHESSTNAPADDHTAPESAGSPAAPATANPHASASRFDEERLVRAWEWVRAHRPVDRPYNELEAETLALLEAASDAGEGSALWQINTGLISALTVRAIDADRDGQVSDDEVLAFLADRESMPPLGEHPFFQNGLNEGNSRLALLERSRLDLWDADLDGRLSDDERNAGERAEFELQVDTLVQRELNAMENQGLFHEAGGREQAEIELRERFMQSPFEAGLPSMAMLTAERMLVAMSLDDLSRHARDVDFNSNVPFPPDVNTFDANADGDVDSAEMLHYDKAMLDYEEAVLTLSEQADVNFLRHRFDAAVSEGDIDGDGALTASEWDMYIDRLIEQRDQRLFLISYDLDGDHSVTQSELSMLLDWHKAGSPRADVNYDGVIDARDLEQAMRRYQLLSVATTGN